MRGLAFAMLLTLGLAACGGDEGETTPTEESGTVSMQVTVESRDDMNDRRPLYMMVSVGGADMVLIEDYDRAADRLFVDENLLARKVLFPGQEVHFGVPIDPAFDLTFYFFYTTPRGTWRYTLPAPLPEQVHLVLGRHGIEYSNRAGSLQEAMEGGGDEDEDGEPDEMALDPQTLPGAVGAEPPGESPELPSVDLTGRE